MKKIDYFRIANLNATANHKQSSNIIRGLALGMIIIIPMLIIFLFLNYEFANKINNSEGSNDFEVNFFKTNVVDNNLSYDYKKVNDAFLEIKTDFNVDSYNLIYNANVISSNESTIIIDNKEYKLDYFYYQSSKYINNISIYDVNNSNKIKNDLLEGDDFFSDNKQVYINEKICDYLQLNKYNVLNKTISFIISLEDGNEIIIDNFTIIGVFENNFNTNEDFLINLNDINLDDYDFTISANITTKNIKCSSNFYKTFSINDLYDVVTKSELFLLYNNLYQLLSYISIAFLVIGIIIILSSFISLYNCIIYSLSKRLGYMGMLKAIGLNENKLKYLFILENAILFFKAVIWTIIIAGILVLTFVLVYNNNSLFKKVSEYSVLKINFFSYLPIFLIVIFITFIVTILLSYLVVARPLKKSVLELMNSEN